MAIAGYSPTKNFPPASKPPEAHSDNYKGIMYDDNKTPLASLIAYIDGASWVVDEYYRKIVAEHNDLTQIDSNLDPQFQGYECIKSLELMVDAQLSNGGNQNEQTMKVVGSANIYPFFVPNVGDVFITKTSYNSSAMFRVSLVERKSFRNEAVHFIEYQLVDYVDRIQNEVNSIREKVIREYVYDRQRLMEGLGPILKTETYAALGNLQKDFQRLGEYYLNIFYDRGTHCLILPGQINHRIYDGFLTEFVMETFGFSTFPAMLGLKQLNKSGDKYLSQPSVWKVIRSQDPDALPWCNQKMKFAATGQFERNTWLKGLFHARMDAVVYPINPDQSMNSFDSSIVLSPYDPGIQATTNGHGRTLTHQEKLYPLVNKSILSYPMILSDDYYVFTGNFYNNKDDDLTLFEIMVRDYLHGRSIDLKQLQHMIKLFPSMERLEQFYFGPLLMMLIRYFEKMAATP